MNRSLLNTPVRASPRPSWKKSPNVSFPVSTIVEDVESNRSGLNLSSSSRRSFGSGDSNVDLEWFANEVFDLVSVPYGQWMRALTALRSQCTNSATLQDIHSQVEGLETSLRSESRKAEDLQMECLERKTAYEREKSIVHNVQEQLSAAQAEISALKKETKLAREMAEKSREEADILRERLQRERKEMRRVNGEMERTSKTQQLEMELKQKEVTHALDEKTYWHRRFQQLEESQRMKMKSDAEHSNREEAISEELRVQWINRVRRLESAVDREREQRMKVLDECRALKEKLAKAGDKSSDDEKHFRSMQARLEQTVSRMQREAHDQSTKMRADTAELKKLRNENSDLLRKVRDAESQLDSATAALTHHQSQYRELEDALRELRSVREKDDLERSLLRSSTTSLAASQQALSSSSYLSRFQRSKR